MSKRTRQLCHELAQHKTNVGRLLYQILFWTPKATVEIEGHLWIAKDRQTWQLQAKLTRNQYDRALAYLRHELKFVELKQAFFGGKNITHVRLTDRAKARLEAAFSMQNEKPDEKPGEKLHIKKVQEPVITGKKDCGLTPAVSTEVCVKFSAKDVIASKGSPALLKKQTLTPLDKLQQVWRDGISEAYGDFVPAFTQQQIGQLKNFAKKCPSSPDSETVLRYALSHWSLFVQIATNEAGAFNLPTKPQLGPLLKFAQVAINMVIQKNQTQPQAPKFAPVVQPVQTFAMTGQQPSGPHAEKATLEEVMAILGDDG